MTFEAELDQRLEAWAAQRKLDDAQLATIRGAIVADAAPAVDADWVWSLLRPVTDLVDWTTDMTEMRLPRRFPGWMQQFIGDDSYQPYLRLT
jgi:hypothetical protein